MDRVEGLVRDNRVEVRVLFGALSEGPAWRGFLSCGCGGLTRYDDAVHIYESVSMARRTVNLPEPTEALVRELAHDGESFSAAVSRLIEAGARSMRGPSRPTYVASGDGPEDLGARAEDYLRAPVTTA